MRKILLGLGAVSVMAVPAVVAVSCNEDTAANPEYGKIADALKAAPKVVLPNDVNTGIGTEYFELDIKLPVSFGVSTPEVLDNIEAKVRAHIGQNANNDAPNAPYGFGIGTWPSTTNGDDDHIEVHLTRGTQWNPTTTDRTLIDDLINFIATIK